MIVGSAIGAASRSMYTSFDCKLRATPPFQAIVPSIRSALGSRGEEEHGQPVPVWIPQSNYILIDVLRTGWRRILADRASSGADMSPSHCFRDGKTRTT